MSEEIHDTSITLPCSIMSGVAVNGVTALLMAVTLVFTLEHITTILESDTNYPFLQVFYNAVKNKSAINAITFLVIFDLTNCAISETATASRQI